jgi:predicted O-methyltransferase YrrM
MTDHPPEAQPETPPETAKDLEADASLAKTTRPEFFDALRQTIVRGGDWCGALMAEIARVLHEGGDWCDGVKAQTLATLVLGLRPRRVCEVGVWIGGSMVPMLLALRALEALEGSQGPVTPRRGIAIDAWSAQASCAGQDDADRIWWGAQPHEIAKQAFLDRLDRHGLARICDVVHASSDDAPTSAPGSIGLLHLDGNHGEQAVRDVEKFAGAVEVGGVLVLDDVLWSGGHVGRARSLALTMGFRELYPLGTGIVLQRIRP